MRKVVAVPLVLALVVACSKKKEDAVDGTVEVTAGEVSWPRVTRGAPIAEIPERDTMKSADDDMKRVLDELAALGGTPIDAASAVEARKQPTPADAVKKLLEKDGKSTEPRAMEKVDDRTIDGPGGKLAVRIYTPKSRKERPLPVVTYFHGGGFVLGSLDTYDASARAIADEAKTIVVSCDYRHAPEAKFPAAHDDAFAAYRWVLANAVSFDGDPRRVAVAGEGAGGNLAINVAIRARDTHVAMPVHALLVYPVATTHLATDSYKEWAHAKPLDTATMAWFFEQSTRSAADKDDPRLDLVHANLAGLPPTTIVLAEIDPLRSDGDLLGKKLDAGGVKVDTKTFEGVTHAFFGMGAEVTDARGAVSWAGRRLEKSLLPR